MIVHQECIPSARPSGEWPSPVSLETLAEIEQMLSVVLGVVRASLTPDSVREAGCIEYDSWLGRRDR